MNVQGRHYKIDAQGLKSWNAAIVKGDATLTSPPLSLHPMPAKKTRKRSRNLDGYSSDPEEAYHRRYNPAINVHVHQGGAKTSNYMHASSDSSGSPVQELVPQDNGNRLDEYIEWHIRRSPEDTEALHEALEALKRECFKLKQLRTFTEERWRGLGVPLGVGMALSDNVKAFLKRRHFNGITCIISLLKIATEC